MAEGEQAVVAAEESAGGVTPIEDFYKAHGLNPDGTLIADPAPEDDERDDFEEEDDTPDGPSFDLEDLQSADADEEGAEDDTSEDSSPEEQPQTDWVALVAEDYNKINQVPGKNGQRAAVIQALIEKERADRTALEQQYQSQWDAARQEAYRLGLQAGEQSSQAQAAFAQIDQMLDKRGPNYDPDAYVELQQTRPDIIAAYIRNRTQQQQGQQQAPQPQAQPTPAQRYQQQLTAEASFYAARYPDAYAAIYPKLLNEQGQSKYAASQEGVTRFQQDMATYLREYAAESAKPKRDERAEAAKNRQKAVRAEASPGRGGKGGLTPAMIEAASGDPEKWAALKKRYSREDFDRARKALANAR